MLSFTLFCEAMSFILLDEVFKVYDEMAIVFCLKRLSILYVYIVRKYLNFYIMLIIQDVSLLLNMTFAIIVFRLNSDYS